MTAPTAYSFLLPLAAGYAELIASANVGFSWRSHGSGLPINLANMPAEPDQTLVITPIPTAAHPTLSIAQGDLQFRFRGGKKAGDVWNMRDAVRYLLMGRFPTVLPSGIHVSIFEFRYGGSMGRDKSDRWEWSDVYSFTARDTRR